MASPDASSAQPQKPEQDTTTSNPYNPNTSFSTTASDPSDAELPPSTSRLNTQAHRSLSKASTPKPTTPVQHIPTQEAYDQWAEVYDSDGNMLQSIDDLELSTMLPKFFDDVVGSLGSSPRGSVSIIDLGCGTGRNTEKVITYLSSADADIEVNITGLDFSRGMLDVAKQKLSEVEKSGKNVNLRLEQADCFPTVSNASASPIPTVQDLHPANAVISTLVLEHVPLKDYFATLAALVAEGGYALVTNMHSEMGRLSQAGFVNKEGVKVRGTSFVFTPEETAEAAREAGFEVLGVRERKMEADIVERGLVGERGKKWIGVAVWYGLVLRKA